MLETALDAKVQLESEGLHVSSYDPHSLWIAGTLRDAGEGIIMSDDACILIDRSGQWTVIFPAEGYCTYEYHGALPELVSVISRVYDQYRQTGVPFKDAFREVVTDPDQYVVGRSPARVNVRATQSAP